MTLSLQLSMSENIFFWHFRLHLLILIFTIAASSPRLLAIGIPFPIVSFVLLKVRMILLIHLRLLWGLGTNFPVITGTGNNCDLDVSPINNSDSDSSVCYNYVDGYFVYIIYISFMPHRGSFGRKVTSINDPLWRFSSSVNSFFKCACAAIQWG